MSELSEFHRKNSFEYVSFLLNHLIERVKEIENV